MNSFLQMVIGFSSGLAVGSGFVAFLTILRVIPRLLQLSKTETYLKTFSSCIILGTLFGTYLSFTGYSFDRSIFLLIIFGLSHGIFNGMLAAGLAEVLNVFPILTARLQVQKYLSSLLMAIVFGKMVGSLFQWLYFVQL